MSNAKAIENPHSKFGTCCDALKFALKGDGEWQQHIWVHARADVLMMDIATLVEDGEMHFHSHPMNFCPFCGTHVQTDEETMRKAQRMVGYDPSRSASNDNDIKHNQSSVSQQTTQQVQGEALPFASSHNINGPKEIEAENYPDNLEEFVDKSIQVNSSLGNVQDKLKDMREREGTVRTITNLVAMGTTATGYHNAIKLDLVEWSMEAAVCRFPDQFDLKTRLRAQLQLGTARRRAGNKS